MHLWSEREGYSKPIPSHSIQWDGWKRRVWGCICPICHPCFSSYSGLGHLQQLIWGDSQTSWEPQCILSAQEASSLRDMPGTVHKTKWRCPWGRCLNRLNWLYSESLLNNRALHPVSKGESGHCAEKTHFSNLYLWCNFFLPPMAI